MSDVTKSTQLFLTNDDENLFSQLLLSAVPGIQFIDDCVWDSSPHIVPSIDTCESNLCYLYDGILENLPVITRPDGKLQGATSGCVIQIVRSRRQGDVLRSGTMGTGYKRADNRMSSFVDSTWKILRKIGTLGVRRPDQKVDRHYLVGHCASCEASMGRLRLRDRSVDIYYDPT